MPKSTATTVGKHHITAMTPIQYGYIFCASGMNLATTLQAFDDLNDFHTIGES